ncbi:hypothetical protein S40293_09879 [Stachybotrys chartarum IBT 40293]|nr:hypothetical protein S40293_09879 [Stachybotrys chartarum IBT 40293]
MSAILHAIVDYLISWACPDAHWGWMSWDRRTGRLQREKQPLSKKLKLLFLFNPITEWIDTTHAMRLYTHDKSLSEGKKEGMPSSRERIQSFVDYYGINMDDFKPSDITKYDSFQDFFTRAHKPGSRQIHNPEDANHVVVVADSRAVTYDSVAETKKLWIKGNNFSITNLVMDAQLGSRFDRAADVKKGEELGYFQFGGSSIIVAFEEGRVVFDQDLVHLSKQKIQVAVQVGMSLGHARSA